MFMFMFYLISPFKIHYKLHTINKQIKKNINKFKLHMESGNIRIAHKSLATYFQWGPLDTKDKTDQIIHHKKKLKTYKETKNDLNT